MATAAADILDRYERRWTPPAMLPVKVWTDDPEVQALLESCRAEWPRAEGRRRMSGRERQEWIEYSGVRVSRLREIHTRYGAQALLQSDAGDGRAWRAHANTDPLVADGYDSVPSFLWHSRTVDRVIYNAIHGGDL